jgi:multidrug transporter EmrE-like cation transporter
MFILWFILACIVICLPITLIGKYIETSETYYILLALAFYGLLTLIYINLLKHEDMAIVYPLLNIISVLVVFLIGVFYFKNKIDIYKIIGIVLSIISILFLTINFNQIADVQ